MKDYDIVVLGAGSGGLVAATEARRSGLRTALLEKSRIGGECTHTGCIPSKTFLASVKLWQGMQERSQYGLQSARVQGQFEFSEIMQHVNDVVESIYQCEQPSHFTDQGIDVFIDPKGAEFYNPHTLKIGSDILHFKNALICTGSSPKGSNIPGVHEVPFLTNENFWALREQPRSITFIGGGIISAELGQALAGLGTDVTIMERNHDILKTVDPEIRHILRQQLESQNITIITEAKIKRISKNGPGTLLEYTKEGKEYHWETEQVFLAAGRKPNTFGLGLHKAGIEETEQGITVNEFLESSVSHIFACGDVASRHKFTHAASAQAKLIVHNLLHQNKKTWNGTLLPWAIFTRPEIAHVGLSEAEARKQRGSDITTFSIKAETDRFITERHAGGLLKVIFDKDLNVLGADGIGAHAGEWIQLINLIIAQKMDIHSVAEMVFPYPTHSEIVGKLFTRFLRTQK